MAFRSLLVPVLLILTLVLDGTAAATAAVRMQAAALARAPAVEASVESAAADCHERHGQRVPLASAVAAHGVHTAHRRWPAGSTTTTGTARTTASEASPLCLGFPPRRLVVIIVNQV